MNPEQFFMKVREMRKMQRQYYSTRSKDALNKSIALEKELDAEIARVEQIKGI